jgi:hypothetical protein
MNNTSLLGDGLQRVVLLLLAGMASGLFMADSLDQLQPAVTELRATHEPLPHLRMPAGLLVACEFQKDAASPQRATCSVRIG